MKFGSWRERPVKLGDVAVIGVFGLLIYGATLMAERLTITSFYPSPYGVYKQLRALGDSSFAAQAGATVGIGTNIPLANTKVTIKTTADTEIGFTGDDTASIYALNNLSLSSPQNIYIGDGASNIMTFDSANAILNVPDAVIQNELTLGGESKNAWPEASIPSGFCVISTYTASCPSGWTRAARLDGRTIRGTGNVTGTRRPGTTSGSGTHSHGFACYAWCGCGSGGHCQAGATDSQTNWPPYTNVWVCCKN
ncbi:hypothetical protein ACFL6Y_03735 [Elusimicrobiota bacterium]